MHTQQTTTQQHIDHSLTTTTDPSTSTSLHELSPKPLGHPGCPTDREPEEGGGTQHTTSRQPWIELIKLHE